MSAISVAALRYVAAQAMVETPIVTHATVCQIFSRAGCRQLASLDGRKPLLQASRAPAWYSTEIETYKALSGGMQRKDSIRPPTQAAVSAPHSRDLSFDELPESWHQPCTVNADLTDFQWRQIRLPVRDVNEQQTNSVEFWDAVDIGGCRILDLYGAHLSVMSAITPSLAAGGEQGSTATAFSFCVKQLVVSMIIKFRHVFSS
jgi:hypothetical protein